MPRAKSAAKAAKPNDLSEKVWLSLSEVSALYGYSYSSLKHWLKGGTLGKHTGCYQYRKGGPWRCNRAEFEETFLKKTGN